MARDRSIRHTLVGPSSGGSQALASANTWYQFPPSGSTPDDDYALVVSTEVGNGIIRWSFAGTGTPSTTNGNKFSSGDMTLGLDGGEFIYIGSSSANDRINWLTKQYT